MIVFTPDRKRLRVIGCRFVESAGPLGDDAETVQHECIWARIARLEREAERLLISDPRCFEIFFLARGHTDVVERCRNRGSVSNLPVKRKTLTEVVGCSVVLTPVVSDPT